MTPQTIHISDDFNSIATRDVDERKRVCLGNIIDNFHRVQIFTNQQGEILIRPVIEVPITEAWLYKNKKAFSSVMKGLQDANEENIEKLDIDSL